MSYVDNLPHRPRTSKRLKLANFHEHKAVILNIHITHHAGTFMCGFARKNHARSPDFACLDSTFSDNWERWNIRFDFIAWEYTRAPRISLYTADWESQYVISILIMRDPLDRLLAGDGIALRRYGPEHNRTAELWWKFANDDDLTNNYALRVLGEGDLSELGVAKAKALIDRITYVIDQACLNENLMQLAQELGWNTTDILRKGTVHHKTARERLENDTLYEFLRKKNANDIALYEWTKQRSLVVCDSIEGPTQVAATGIPKKDLNLESAVQVSGKGTLDDLKLESASVEANVKKNEMATKETKLKNYREHKALIVNIHITHHAGTFMCGFAKNNNIRVPDFACLHGVENSMWSTWKGDDDWPKWLRQYDFMAWEFNYVPGTSLYTNDWESEHVISILVMRDPLDRLLAGDAISLRRYGRQENRTDDQWWAFANDDQITNNFALRVLGMGDLTETGVAKAKALINRMTYVLDQACLNDNLLKLAEELGWNSTDLLKKDAKHHKTARERLGNDTLYEFLRKKNTNDIALYEWSKKKSLVVCDSAKVFVNESLETNTTNNTKLETPFDRTSTASSSIRRTPMKNAVFFAVTLALAVTVLLRKFMLRTRAQSRARHADNEETADLL